MKKSFALVCFLLSSSSFLQAKDGLRKIICEGADESQLLRLRSFKVQKVAALEKFIEEKNPVSYPPSSQFEFLKIHYEHQIEAINEALKEKKTLSSSVQSRSSNSFPPPFFLPIINYENQLAMINITKEDWMSQDELETLKTIFKDIKPQESHIASSSSSIQSPEFEGPFSSSSDAAPSTSGPLTSSVSLAGPSPTLVVNLDKDEADYLNKLTKKGRELLNAVLKRKDVEHIDLSEYFDLNEKSKQKEALKAIKTIQKLLMNKAAKPVINMGTRLEKLTNKINDADNNQDDSEFTPELLNHGGKLFKYTRKLSILSTLFDKLTDLMGSDDLGKVNDLEWLENLKTAFARVLKKVPKKEKEDAEKISKMFLKISRLQIVHDNLLERRKSKSPVSSSSPSIQKPELEGPFSSSTQGPKFQTSPESYIPHPFSSSSSSNGSSGSSAKTTFRTAGANEVAEIKHSAVYASFSYQNNPDAVYSLIINHRTKDKGSMVRVHNPNARAYINLGRLSPSVSFSNEVFDLFSLFEAAPASSSGTSIIRTELNFTDGISDIHSFKIKSDGKTLIKVILGDEGSEKQTGVYVYAPEVSEKLQEWSEVKSEDVQ